ncbi:hypothetical protein BDU57DRAFT_531576 [Ampelomyces quisqualis]|uniref:Uncharacterized protein n=1 Tax=Ampelomyces quisqualis TaxID=50730 RepID=A0A6A5QFV3_AMPQU|nr:hypothetical protein BDU57DRAFT_531576 [Ampelomyces quisqualis]
MAGPCSEGASENEVPVPRSTRAQQHELGHFQCPQAKLRIRMTGQDGSRFEQQALEVPAAGAKVWYPGRRCWWNKCSAWQHECSDTTSSLRSIPRFQASHKPGCSAFMVEINDLPCAKTYSGGVAMTRHLIERFSRWRFAQSGPPHGHCPGRDFQTRSRAEPESNSTTQASKQNTAYNICHSREESSISSTRKEVPTSKSESSNTMLDTLGQGIARAR